MSSSVSESYTGLETLQNIYHRLIGRGSSDCKGQNSPSAADTLASSFDLMELSSPADAPIKFAPPSNASQVSRGDEAARANYDHVFTDPNALDFLWNCTQDSKSTFIDPGKESLLTKFDPLRSKRPVSESFVDQSTSLMSVTESDFGYHTESNLSVIDRTVTPKRTYSMNIPREKPTQVVNPAVKPVLCDTIRPPLVRSLSAIMSPARVAIDRLINYGDGDQASPPINLLTTSPQYDPQIERLHSLRAILQKQEHETNELREENSDLKFAIRDLEKNLKRANEECEELKEKEKKLTRQLQEKTLSNKQMGVAMEEYEKTISALIGEQQAERTAFREKEKSLRSEQDQIQSHLLSMESAFNDLLAKYEKCKTRMNEFKEMEESHRAKILEYERANVELENLFTTLKNVTSEKLSKANETLETINKNHESEVMKLNAIIKKYDVQVSSLQESLAQKIKDNEQLTVICDELISKVH